MGNDTPAIRRTFRICIDVEADIQAEPEKVPGDYQEQVRFHQALIQRLLEHPAQLERLLSIYTIHSLKNAGQILREKYVQPYSEQQLLQSIIGTLEPAARQHFTEEFEDNVSVYLFNGCQANIKQVNMTTIEQEA
uniref:Uncharacterized protein n=1 Tax=Thermosporothrix sp. COM3 TaxID=2490863 RepID=A0A455SJR0_9CHLR|nr:hypothetical protein KTC_11260 [Thermosporothrix sp. COM3]